MANNNNNRRKKINAEIELPILAQPSSPYTAEDAQQREAQGHETTQPAEPATGAPDDKHGLDMKDAAERMAYARRVKAQIREQSPRDNLRVSCPDTMDEEAAVRHEQHLRIKRLARALDDGVRAAKQAGDLSKIKAAIDAAGKLHELERLAHGIEDAPPETRAIVVMPGGMTAEEWQRNVAAPASGREN